MKTAREVLLGRHRDIEPKLDQMWRVTLRCGLRGGADAAPRSSVQASRVPTGGLAWRLWCELIWPCRRTWAGLACAWVVILMLNVASSERVTPVATRTGPRSHAEMRALAEQRRMLTQLIEGAPIPVSKQKSIPTSPRSDRALEVYTA